MLDHGHGVAGVAVGDHGHVAVPLAHPGLIDQKHPAPAAAAVLGQHRGPGPDHTVDQMPVAAVAASRGQEWTRMLSLRPLPVTPAPDNAPTSRIPVDVCGFPARRYPLRTGNRGKDWLATDHAGNVTKMKRWTRQVINRREGTAQREVLLHQEIPLASDKSIARTQVVQRIAREKRLAVVIGTLGLAEKSHSKPGTPTHHESPIVEIPLETIHNPDILRVTSQSEILTDADFVLFLPPIHFLLSRSLWPIGASEIVDALQPHQTFAYAASRESLVEELTLSNWIDHFSGRRLSAVVELPICRLLENTQSTRPAFVFVFSPDDHVAESDSGRLRIVSISIPVDTDVSIAFDEYDRLFSEVDQTRHGVAIEPSSGWQQLGIDDIDPHRRLKFLPEVSSSDERSYDRQPLPDAIVRPSILSRLAENKKLTLVVGKSPPSESRGFAFSGDSHSIVELPISSVLHLREREALAKTEAIRDADIVFLLPPLHFILNETWWPRGVSDVASTLEPHQCFGFVLSRELLMDEWRGPSSEWRRLLRLHSLSAMIEMPASYLLENAATEAPVCVLLFDQSSSRIASLSIPPGTEVESAFNELRDLQSSGGRTANGIAIEPPIDWTSLTPQDIDLERVRKIEESAKIGILRPLTDLCELIFGFGGSRSRSQRGDHKIPVITPKVMRGGVIALDDVTEWADHSADPRLRRHDLLIGAVNDWHAKSYRLEDIQAVEVHDDHLPAIAGKDVLVVRPNEDLCSAERLAIRHYLKSGRFAEQIIGRDFFGNTAIRSDLDKTFVPIPTSEFLDAFRAVDFAVDEFRTWQNEGSHLIELSMDAKNHEEARQLLISASQLLRQRASAARLLDDLNHRVSTRFPLPIAYRWSVARTLCNAKRATDMRHAINEALDAYEVLLAYLAILGLTFARSAEGEVSLVGNAPNKLTSKKGGLDLGVWIDILTKASDAVKFTRRLPPGHPFILVHEFFRDNQIVDASKTLAKLRNDIAHSRSPDTVDLPNTLRMVWDKLSILYRAAEFVTDYPLVRVDDTKWNQLARVNSITYGQLSGDNPIVPMEEMTLGELEGVTFGDSVNPAPNEVEDDSLYVMAAGRHLYLLRPLLVGQECGECKHWATFFPERVDTGGYCYKSLERGHTMILPSEEVEEALRAVGFLS